MASGLRGSFRCAACGAALPGDAPVWRCPACRGPLDWLPPAGAGPLTIGPEPSLWRYGDLLPVGSDATLGEHITPLVPLPLDGATPLLKLDSLLPTGSFKDRGAAVLTAGLARLGITEVVEDSSGNAAAALAAYAARAGMRCTIFVPAAASRGKLVQVQAAGAALVAVDGSRDDVTFAAETAAEAGAFYASHNWHPWFVAGVATWALEVWEQLGGRAPDAVITPAGSGSMILGAAFAFGELRRRGMADRLPRLYAAQATACAPVALAWERGAAEPAAVERTATLAEGIVIPRPVRGRALLAALRESGGGAAAVTE
ncbi:MAG: pyridoxal-phosphate dependent enzyme, partial [Chloroflexi bacterium]|nr:pyridoxal-phosphate dependent enzyme [Chloroflexota bacterium]